MRGENARGDAWADENAVGDVIREPVEHCKLQNEHCKLKILGKRYSLVNLHFAMFILQFAINTEAGQPQIPKAIQVPYTQAFSPAQAMPDAVNRNNGVLLG